MERYHKRHTYLKVGGHAMPGWWQHLIFSFDNGSMFTLMPYSRANWYGNRDRWKGDRKTVRLD